MPDPTAHADDMKSFDPYVPPTVKDNDTLPPLWWLNPWNTVLGLLHKVDHLKSTSRGEQASRISAEGLANLHKTERYDFLRNVEVTLEAVLSPDGYNDTIDLVVLAADEIKRLRASLSVMTEDRDAYIEKLQAERVVYCDTVHKLEKAEARVKQLTVFCENAGAERDRLKDDLEKERIDREHGMCCDSAARYKAHKTKIEKLKADLADEKQAVRNLRKYLAKESRLLRKEQAKVNKLERAQRKPLWEDKTTGWTLTHGNHEDSPGMTRKERIAWLGGHAHLGPIKDPQTFRHGVPLKTKAKRKAKAKKKGGAK